MALPFFSSSVGKRRDQLISVDLGGRTTKAVHLHRKGEGYTLSRYVLGGRAAKGVHLHRKGEGYTLSRYVLLDAPVYENGFSTDVLREHLKAVFQSLDADAREVTVSVDMGDAVVRHADLPLMPVSEMRQILKNNSKAYLQQDLSGHVFDCFVSASNGAPKPGDKDKGTSVVPKLRTLVAGARQDFIEGIQKAVREAGRVPESILPGLLGPVNAFEAAVPELFAQESLALVDIGFKNTSICLLQEGELVLSRVVAIGGDKLTSGLAELMGISYAEAESIKVGIPAEVQSQLESLLLPLGRELRASIDCFEHQQDKAVTKVFISGGTAASEFIVKILQAELLAECKTWNPLASVKLGLTHEQTLEVEQAAPQLTVAVGAAMAAF